MSASVPTLVGGKPWEILQGDVRAVLKAMPDNYFDAVLSDPPYGLSFMGKRWDYFLPSVNVWTELLRVVKPGAHVMLFGGSLQAGWDEVVGIEREAEYIQIAEGRIRKGGVLSKLMRKNR